MPAIFGQEFIDELPDDAVLACASICETVLSFNRQRLDETGNASYIEDQNAYLESVALFQVFTETHPLDVFYELPKLGTNTEENSRAIVEFFEKLNAEVNKLVVNRKLSSFRDNYSARLGQSVIYEFSAKERELIIKLIHELRVLIGDWEKLETHQRTRLLSRLGKIHGMISGKSTSLDIIWGLWGEANLIKAKYGSSAQLIIDRINQIINLGWRVQARTEGVSANNADSGSERGKEKARGSGFLSIF